MGSTPAALDVVIACNGKPLRCQGNFSNLLEVELDHYRLGQFVSVKLAGVGKFDNPDRDKLDDRARSA
jgi:hypothetical protein